MDFFSFFAKRPIPAIKFEECVFDFLRGRLTGAQNVREELEGVRNLRAVSVSEEQQDQFAAHWYLALEKYISQEQPKNRVPKETLREWIVNHCHPERAEGGLALIFLISPVRQIKFFEKLSELVFQKARKALGDKNYLRLLNSLIVDSRYRDVLRKGLFDWPALEKKARKLTPAEQRAFVLEFLKKLMGALVKNLADSFGELRTEQFLFKESYREFREHFKYLDDAPQALLIVPDEFLKEERIALMQKAELEEEFKKKSREMEAAVIELSAEKQKFASLSREELEKMAAEKTADLAATLEDLKFSRAKIAEAKAKDEAFLESVNEGLAAIDRDWNIILWNKAAAELSGWSKEEALGKPLRGLIKLIKEGDRSENVVFIEEAMVFGKTTRSEGNNLLKTKSGSELAISGTASPVLDQGGKAASVVIILRDISKERELEKSKEEFASLATHQLRTPLTIIKGFVSLLFDEKETGPVSEKQRHHLGEIQEAAGKLLQLVNAMLNVSRIELGTLAINPEPAYLPEISDGVLDELKPLIEKKKMAVTKEYDKNLPSVNVDVKLTHAVFQNLISNAVKYTPEKGRIKISIEKQQFDALIKIQDNGYGIPKHQQNKIFSKLFRADNIVRQEPEGTGLGLYIVKSIVEQAGGKVWFESPAFVEKTPAGKEENKGTIFYVSLSLLGMKKREGTKGLT